MTRTFAIFAIAAVALAGCDNSDHTIVAGPGADETPVNNVGVELPPAIAASKIYRCKDNSVVYIDWLSDQKTANFRPDQNATPVQLKAPEAGQPMVAEGGYSLTGSQTAGSVTLERPGKGSQSCKA
jgi:crotonobetainyl-CoA:carnitine CoA-transferase CaiB-like acyl-CoA transferase